MRKVDIVEVSPRDGLQNEELILSTEKKVELITRGISAGLRKFEAASFVNPKKVPQMADAEAVMASLPRLQDVSYVGLALNRVGAERAIAAKVDEVNYVVIATDTYNLANQGCTSAETFSQWPEISSMARGRGVSATFTIASTFGCPFEGEVSLERVLELATAAASHQPDEIILADSIGVAAPSDVKLKVESVIRALPDIPVRCHFHNTRNTGLANAVAAIEAGARGLDSSIGGIGGCPFAPGATGNIATEDLAYMLKRMGLVSLSLDHLVETAQWLAVQIGHEVPGMLSRAGVFPQTRHESGSVNASMSRPRTG